MTDLLITLTMAGAALLGLGILAFAGLRGWQGWLELKRMELTNGQTRLAGHGGTAERIEMADLKERIRKLENIAACIDI